MVRFAVFLKRTPALLSLHVFVRSVALSGGCFALTHQSLKDKLITSYQRYSKILYKCEYDL